MSRKGRSVSDELEPMDSDAEEIPPPTPDPGGPPLQEIDPLTIYDSSWQPFDPNSSVRFFTDDNGKKWMHVHELIGNRWFDRCVPVGNR